VILFHVNPDLFPNGYLGVDLFFGISGLVLGASLIRLSNRSPKVAVGETLHFWQNRIFRLLPSFSVTVSAAVLVVYFFGLPEDFMPTLKQAIYSFFLVGNIGAVKFSGPTYWAPNPNPLLHTWSLSVEEQIYFFLPILIIILSLFFTKIEFIKRFIVCLVFIALAIDIFLQVNLASLDPTSTNKIENILYYSPIRRLWEFGVGLIIALYPRESLVKKVRVIPKYLVVLLMIVLMRIDGKSELVLITLLITFSYFALTPDTEARGALSRWLVWIGDHSYSIYLVHFPLIYILKQYLSVNSILFTLITLVTSFFISAMLYGVFENRLRNKPRTSGNTKVLLGAFFVLPTVCLIGLFHLSSSNLGSKILDYPLLSFYNHPECDLTASAHPCEYRVPGGDGGILLVGDSHAASLADALIASGQKYKSNVFVWAKINCPFHLNITESEPFFQTDTSGNQKTTCLEHNLAIKNWLEANPNVNLVVTNRSYYGYRKYFGISQDLKGFYGEIAASIQDVRGSRSTYFIDSTPEILENKRIFATGRFWQTFSNGMLPQSLFMLDNELDSQTISKIVRSLDVSYFGAKQLICFNGSCMTRHKGQQVFYDYHHLSISGGDLLTPIFDKIFSYS
jgi:peptidoglycan/LPS O-acetylase OafA/YrhL